MSYAERTAFSKKVRKVSMSKLDDLFYEYRHSDAETMNLTEDDMIWILDTIQNEYHRRMK